MQPVSVVSARVECEGQMSEEILAFIKPLIAVAFPRPLCLRFNSFPHVMHCADNSNNSLCSDAFNENFIFMKNKMKSSFLYVCRPAELQEYCRSNYVLNLRLCTQVWVGPKVYDPTCWS